MVNQYLMVPVRLDALHVAKEMSVVDQAAAFQRLPFFERALAEEFNSETANLSEAIVADPFQNKTLRLKPGIHLHWALPDALTHGSSEFRFPQVPNRWLVTRRRQGQVDKQWIVESDYLFPPHVNKQGTAVCIPYVSERWERDPDADSWVFCPEKPILSEAELADREAELADRAAREAGRAAQPFRFMGRNMPLDAWREHFAGAEYVPALTALGYGEPSFAAFYPNCFSVFGFHDPHPGALTDLRYEIAGWYADPATDVLAQFTDHLQTSDPALDETAQRQAVRDRFQWDIPAEETGVPNRLLCYGGIHLAAAGASDHPHKERPVAITVANTPTEALSARLARLLTSNPNRREDIEDQLEALQLTFRLDGKQLDTLARFRELRHENGFTPLAGGHLWVIRQVRRANLNGTGTAVRDALGALPPEIAADLNRVNLLQKQYDTARREIAQLRRRLFADWYKYMVCAYPPDLALHDYPAADLVRYFIHNKLVLPLERKLATTGRLDPPTLDDEGNISGIAAAGSRPNALATRLAAEINALIHRIEEEENNINREQNTNDNYYLEQIPGPRFWQPNDPVVLMSGEAVDAGERHGRDGVLTCHLFSPSAGKLFSHIRDFSATVAEVHTRLGDGASFALNTRQNQPWNPFLLEWEVQVFPTESNSNQHFHRGLYDERFITDNYQAPGSSPDLELKPGRSRINKVARVYSGSSILTPQAGPLLKRAIERQLIERLAVFDEPAQISSAAYQGSKTFDNPAYTMIKAYEEAGGLYISAQSLTGFNQALLMHKQTMELAIDDPLAFADYRSFTSEQVGRAMGDCLEIAPSPLHAFNPIRSGCLKLTRLRLVDTFGQTRDLDTNQIDTTTKMTSPRSRYLVRLPPRLVQPARLNFRWLNAGADTMETNVHRATNPICGWLLTNRTDRSLMIYDADGRALGYFKAGAWHEAIGSDRAKAIEEITNPHLKRAVVYIRDNIEHDEGGLYLDHLIGTLDDALDNIQPEGADSIRAGSLLIGRPLAVVRAVLDLQLHAPPAVNQDWNVFRHDLGASARTSDGFSRVLFPVRLGEYGRLGDGLAGYWLERTEEDGRIGFATESLDAQGRVIDSPRPFFYAPQNGYILTHPDEAGGSYLSQGSINFYQSIADDPQHVTMLMDVRGTVHATVGVLPNKEISIPREQYSRALAEIEISFLHAPLLTRQGKIDLPLRAEPGYEWCWVERERGPEGETWKEWFPKHRIERRVFIERWRAETDRTDGDEAWAALLDPAAAWLAPLDDNGADPAATATLLDEDERNTLSGILAGLDDLVAAILDRWAEGIEAVVSEAGFSGPHEFREGWLKLRAAASEQGVTP
ncbi:MAG: hypothetical protein QNK37_17805 [Acidobacteriota bacterium]|nr:hypothetical protein [Acidobacteriota bacterium]